MNPSCARQGRDGGEKWEVYIVEAMFGGSSITVTERLTEKVQKARKSILLHAFHVFLCRIRHKI